MMTSAYMGVQIYAKRLTGGGRFNTPPEDDPFLHHLPSWPHSATALLPSAGRPVPSTPAHRPVPGLPPPPRADIPTASVPAEARRYWNSASAHMFPGKGSAAAA